MFQADANAIRENDTKELERHAISLINAQINGDWNRI